MTFKAMMPPNEGSGGQGTLLDEQQPKPKAKVGGVYVPPPDGDITWRCDCGHGWADYMDEGKWIKTSGTWIRGNYTDITVRLMCAACNESLVIGPGVVFA